MSLQPETAAERRLREVGDALGTAVKTALAALEQSGVIARDADEFVRECVFSAWWDWDYEPITDEADEVLQLAQRYTDDPRFKSEVDEALGVYHVPPCEPGTCSGCDKQRAKP